MKITYDKTADALYIYFKTGSVFATKEINDGLIVDFDNNNKIVGLEILDASKNMSDLTKKASIIIGNKELELPALVEK